MQHDAVFSDCHITYVPIFLGGLMKACGNTPPINIKSKSVSAAMPHPVESRDPD